MTIVVSSVKLSLRFSGTPVGARNETMHIIIILPVNIYIPALRVDISDMLVSLAPSEFIAVSKIV